MAGSPFEQFEIQRVIPIRLGETLDISVTNSAIYMGIAVGVYMLLYRVNIEEGTIVPGRWQAAMEMVYGQIVNMVMDNIGDGKYVPFI